MSAGKFSDKISLGKIGTGRGFTAGSLSSNRPTGLAKTLRGIKQAGKHSYAANLSKKDMEVFHGLIGKELKNLSAGSSGLSYQARHRIMMQAERLRLQGVISAEDKKDLRNIVTALGPGGGGAAAKAAIEKKQAALEAQRQKIVRAGIKYDVAQEMAAEDEGLNAMKYDPKSALGKMASRLEEERQAPAKKLAEKKAALDKQVSDARTNFKPPKSDSAFAEPPDLDIG